MRVQHNIMALSSHRQLGLASDTIGKSLGKLPSDHRINRAGDDAAGPAISEKVRTQIKGLESATANTQDAISLVQTTEGAMQEVHTILNCTAELATKAANSTYDAADRQTTTDEVEALNEEIDRISTSAEFSDKKLLDGTATALVLQVGPTAAGTVTVEINKVDSVALHLDALDFTSTGNANAALTAIRKAINDMSRARSGVGALQNRLGHTMNNLSTTKENLTAVESRVGGVDMTGKMISYIRNSALVQSAQAMLTQVNLQPQSILQLL